MEIKKCSNCGAFTTAEDALCSVCATQLSFSNTVLKNYFDENANFDSIQSISSTTGLSPSIVQNYMIQNNYIDAPTNATDDYYTNLPY